jgi:hypothetical protein
MTPRIIDCEQGSPEWHAARCGRVTGSRIGDITRKIKNGAPSKMWATYLGELVAERLSGVQTGDGYVSPAMQRGKDFEGKGLATYAFMYDVEVQRVGFVIHPTIEMAGASPDALVADVGGLELKCPNTATHCDSLLGAEIDPDYVKQCQWNMACTGRDWWDLASFDPRLPPTMQLHVRRVRRDDEVIAELETAVTRFIAELDAKVADLLSRYGERKEAA